MNVTISVDLQRDPRPPTSAELRGGLRIEVVGSLEFQSVDDSPDAVHERVEAIESGR